MKENASAPRAETFPGSKATSQSAGAPEGGNDFAHSEASLRSHPQRTAMEARSGASETMSPYE